MSLKFPRFAILAAVTGLAACSSGTQSAPTANVPSVQISTLPSGEHVVRLGSHVIRYGGPRRAVSTRRGWISLDAKRKQLLYGSSYNGGFVNIYKAGGNNQQPIGQLTSGLVSPQGMVVDRKHRLWVANTNGFTIEVFKRGATAPYKTLSNPGYYAISVAVDSHGTVYAANAAGGSGQKGNVTVWANGSTSPTGYLTYSNFNVCSGVGVDKNDNVYVSYVPTSGPPTVVEFPAGSQNGAPLGIGSPGLSNITFDSSGNLVMETLYGTLGIWAPPYTSGPARTINALGNSPTINKTDKKIWIAYANPTNGMIEGYNYTSGALVDTITAGFNDAGYPQGVAVDPQVPQ